jgi:hypothetical protein
MKTKRKFILMVVIAVLTAIPFVANAQTSLVLKREGVGCLKTGMLFSEIPSSCPGLYDFFEKNTIEEYEGEYYTEYTFHSGTEIVAHSNDYGEGKINYVVVYSPEISTTEGVHPGMLIKRFLKIKGAKFDSRNDGVYLVLNGCTIGYRNEDLTASGKKAFDNAYAYGTDVKFSTAYFKESAKITSISF